MVRLFLRSLWTIMVASAFLWSATTPVLADENFGIKLAATYTILPTGQTEVQQHFTLRNKTPTLYATNYGIEFGSTKLSNIRVYNDHGKDLSANIVATDNKTSIGITLPEKIVGQDKTQEFWVSFTHPDSAVITGNILEVYIPKLLNAGSYEGYDVIIKSPAEFGDPIRALPRTYTLTHEKNQVVLHFSGGSMESISALYGERQFFRYSLQYQLTNPTSSVGVIQVALPPDTSRQKVWYSSLDPQPENIARDQDGNWIATYEIAAQKDLTVTVQGKAMLTLEPELDIHLPDPSSQLTAADTFWETTHPTVKELAASFTTPKEIYDFSVSRLAYNYNKIDGVAERLGVLGALKQPQNAACQEFTDVFIALARANGIPARRTVGYAATSNARLRPLGLVTDILHVWPEYYDAAKRDWIPIDPTWGNTTGGINYFDQFDFNHFVFAINGQSSSTPYAAGTYRHNLASASPLPSSNATTTLASPLLETPRQLPTKLVDVEYVTAYEPPVFAADLKITRDTSFPGLFENVYLLHVKNMTGAAWYQLPVRVQANQPGVNVTHYPDHLAILLPFQTTVIPFRIEGISLIEPAEVSLTASIDQVSSSYVANTGLQAELVRPLVLPLIGVGGGLVIIALISWRVLVPRRSRYRPVRR